MNRNRCLLAVTVALSLGTGVAHAQNLLTNGNLDRLQDVEIVPGFFLPKPANWQNVGTRSITGPYEDEMSSEPWAGPSPTPVTADGLMNPAPNNQPDYAVFFKPFSGGGPNGTATGHLMQDVPGTPGARYTLTGWAGAEANVLMARAVFALDFLNAGGGLIGSAELDLLPMLLVDNGLAFDYKEYSVSGTAPAGTATVRARASMIDAMGNPAGGGQAFVVDDFTLVPAPTSGLALTLFSAASLRRRRR